MKYQDMKFIRAAFSSLIASYVYFDSSPVEFIFLAESHL